MNKPTLYTPRLMLRPFAMTDAPRIVEILANAREISQNLLLVPFPYTHDNAIDWLSTHEGNWASGKAFNFAICLRDSELLIGSTSGGVNEHHCCTVGYWLATEYWGQGIMTESLKAVIGFCFEQMGVNRVQADHFAFNPASGRVMQKAGMQFEGIMRERYFKEGRYIDAPLYAILKRDWEANRAE